MPETIQCRTHGETQSTYVCNHVINPAAGRGFNRDDPSDDNPFPDAWCDDCEIIFQAHDGWTDEAQKLAEIVMICSGCYELARIRNTRTNVTFDDLSELRWKCHTCEEWHKGPCLDFSYEAPVYWSRENDDVRSDFIESDGAEIPDTFLTADTCAIDGEDFFIRGVLHLPIIGTAETLRWGIWGSVSNDNFKKLISSWDDPKRVDLPPMFSWLSNNIDDYPDTVNLKLYAHVKVPGERPIFEIEPTDHPLSQEYYQGISPERVKAIMTQRLRDTE